MSQEDIESDVEEFTKKLEEWGNGLPPNHRALLRAMIERATGSIGEDGLSDDELSAVTGGARASNFKGLTKIKRLFSGGSIAKAAGTVWGNGMDWGKWERSG